LIRSFLIRGALSFWTRRSSRIFGQSFNFLLSLGPSVWVACHPSDIFANLIAFPYLPHGLFQALGFFCLSKLSSREYFLCGIQALLADRL